MALDPKLHGKGLAHEIIALILADLRAHGVTRIQAFPKAGKGLSKTEIFGLVQFRFFKRLAL